MSNLSKYCAYKLKEGMDSGDKIQDSLSNIVNIIDFVRSPLEEDYYVLYRHMDIETLEYTSMLREFSILKIEDFEERFELYKTVDELNEILRNLEDGKI